MDREARSFSRDALGELLELAAHNASARWPAMTRMMPGDIAWQLPGSAPRENIRLWSGASGLAGYAWLQPPGTLVFDLREGSYHEGLADEMLDWLEHRRLAFDPGFPFYLEVDSMEEWAGRIQRPRPSEYDAERCLIASAFESDASAGGFLERRGFEPTKHFEPFLVRDLEDLPEPDLPQGMRVRHVLESDYEQRVEVHRASWWPASGYTLDRYLAVRAVSQAFDPELDLVVEAADGTFAAYCICWSDPVSRVGFYEPVGTRPEWRGRGVSRAVLFEGLRRLRAKGMTAARVYTAGFNHAALRLYRSCGFELVDRSRTFVKRAPPAV